MRLFRAGLAVLNDKVYAVGGFNGNLRVRTVDVYDPAKDSWSTCTSMEARRSTLGEIISFHKLTARLCNSKKKF